jgi:hypothetical protein
LLSLHLCCRSNPVKHLTACFGGDPVQLLRTIKEGGGVAQDLIKHVTTNKEKAVYAWIRLITLENVSLSSVDKEEFRKFAVVEKTCSKTVRATMLQLTELVERKISSGMGDRGALMFDGWSVNNMHYVAVYGCYMRKHKVLLRGRVTYMEEVAVDLLAMSPMPAVDPDAPVTAETTTFNAAAHRTFFENTLGYYGLDTDWIVCLIGDNCSVNLKLADDLGVPIVGCDNHKLNLEVQALLADPTHGVQISRIIGLAHDAMKAAKTKNTIAAALRNLTSLMPVMYSKTRWNGKVALLQRYERIKEAMAQVPGIVVLDDEDQAMLTVYRKKLEVVDECSRFLQTDRLKVATCRFALDMLMEKTAAMANFNLGTGYIGPDANIIHNPEFQSGVIKLQNGEAATLSQDERDAVQSLLLHHGDDPVEVLEIPGEEVEAVPGRNRFAEQLAKRRRLEEAALTEYADCSYIMGSTAKVERLFSKARHLMPDCRKNMTPLLFEAILFLKENAAYWNLALVTEAMSMNRTARAEGLIQEDNALLAVNALEVD